MSSRTDRPLAVRTSLLAIVIVVSTACGSPRSRDEFTQGPFTYENSLAAHVLLPSDIEGNSELWDSLTMAMPGEPSQPSGFIPGLWQAGSTSDGNGERGIRLIFDASSEAAQRRVLDERATRLDLNVTWIGLDDQWPHCVGIDPCKTPGDEIAAIR